ncbi:ABC transporter substrate-binding protein [Aeromonas cavernicola]|uniref:ABC transporter substrate-binding protein n=1 Tax=Aeromonas cavernicola TaxID=1006623 RepID=A0A2H9U860_9GAMM|nr:ABC transporter substrate binding protein [Aeromonas cavernicola]PJG60233.1 hypothetical protein CUC53_03020 [Aeromonas cavernicola]
MIRLSIVLWLCLTPPAHALNIAMVLWRGETPAEAAFRAELIQLGYQPNITIFNGEQDRAALATMLRRQMLPKLAEFDYIYTFGTTATAMTKMLVAGRKPIIFNMVFNPFESGFLAANEPQHQMMTGTSQMVPMALQLANARQYLPAGKRLLVPFNPREQNTRFITEMLKHEAERFEWQVATWRMLPVPARLAADLKRLQEVAKNDIVFLASDSYLLSIAPQLLKTLNDAGIPTICSAERFVEYGCTVSTVSSYQVQGKMAATIIHRNLQGTPLQDIPLQVDDAPRLVLGSR